MSDPVELELREPIAVLRLNRPAVHNAVDDVVMQRLEEVLDVLERSDVRAAIVTGTGDETFCAGGDLTYFTTLETCADGGAMSRRMQAILTRLTAEPRVVIAALNGNVIGGGCEIAVACHLRIAAAGIRFGFRPAALGLIPGWGGGLRLFRLLGRSSALRLLLLAETIDVDEALRLGLVDRVVGRRELMDQAMIWAERIASHSPAAIRALLELDRAVGRDDEDVIVETETRLFTELWGGDDFRRVLESWRQRRGEPSDTRS